MGLQYDKQLSTMVHSARLFTSPHGAGHIDGITFELPEASLLN